MGNFSVNHYARLTPVEGGLRIRYVLDLAEIPTFELMQDWGAGTDPKQKALEQARLWAKGLEITVAGRPAAVRVERAEITLADGAGNMPVARIAADLRVAGAGKVRYEDRNYAGRSGWKEIVMPGSEDQSRELTAYPQDPMIAPPQALAADIVVRGPAPDRRQPPATSAAAPQQPAPATPAPSALSAPSAPGTAAPR